MKTYTTNDENQSKIITYQRTSLKSTKIDESLQIRVLNAGDMRFVSYAGETAIPQNTCFMPLDIVVSNIDLFWRMYCPVQAKCH